MRGLFRGAGNSPPAPVLLFAGLTVLLCAIGFYAASSFPDGLQAIARRLGFAGKARSLVAGPLADYEFPWLGSGAGRTIVAAFTGASVCFLAAFGIGKYFSRREKHGAPGPARPLE